MKLKDIDIKKLCGIPEKSNPVTDLYNMMYVMGGGTLPHLCVMEEVRKPGEKMPLRIEEYSVKATLQAIPQSWWDREVKDVRDFFGTKVIELYGNTDTEENKNG